MCTIPMKYRPNGNIGEIAVNSIILLNVLIGWYERNLKINRFLMQNLHFLYLLVAAIIAVLATVMAHTNLLLSVFGTTLLVFLVFTLLARHLGATKTSEAGVNLTPEAGKNPTRPPEMPPISPEPMPLNTPLLEHIPSPFLILSDKGRVTYANLAARKLLPDIPIGQHFSTLVRAPVFFDAVTETQLDGAGRVVQFNLSGNARVIEAQITRLPRAIKRHRHTSLFCHRG